MKSLKTKIHTILYQKNKHLQLI